MKNFWRKNFWKKIWRKKFEKTFLKHKKFFLKNQAYFFGSGAIIAVFALVIGYSNCTDVKFSMATKNSDIPTSTNSNPTPSATPTPCPSGQVVSGSTCVPATCDTSGISTSEQQACPSPLTGVRTRTRTVTCDGTTAVPGPWGSWDNSGCSCPAGSGEVLDVATGTCSCPAGQSLNLRGVCTSSTCDLSGISLAQSMPCPSGLGLAWRHRTAYCNGSTPVTGLWGPWDYSGCSCPTGSGETPNRSTGVCQCPMGQQLDPSTQQCTSGPGGSGNSCSPVTRSIACPMVSGALGGGQGSSVCTVCTVNGVTQPPSGCTNNYSGCKYDGSYCSPNGDWISHIGSGYPPSYSNIDTGSTIHTTGRCPCPSGTVDIQGVCGTCPASQPVYNSAAYSCSNCSGGLYNVNGTCQSCPYGYNAATQTCNPPSMSPVTTQMNCSAVNNTWNTCTTDMTAWIPPGVTASQLKITGGSIIRWFNHGNDWPHVDTSKDVKVQIVGTKLVLSVYEVRVDLKVTVAAGAMYTGSTTWYAGQLHDPWCEANNYNFATPDVPDAPIGSHFTTTEPRCDGAAGGTPYTCTPNTGQNSAYSLWYPDVVCEPPAGGGGGGTQL